MKNLGRYRSFAAVFVFLIADVINISWDTAGKATWLVYLAGASLAIPFYRVCVYLCSRPRVQPRGAARLLNGIFLLMLTALSTVMIGSVLGEFGLFISTSNDFSMPTEAIVAMVGGTALCLALLKGHGFERYIDAAFAAITFFFGVFFLTSVNNWKIGRLLPIFEVDGIVLAEGLLKTFIRPFVQGFMVIAVLGRRFDKKDLYPASCWAACAAGVMLSLEHVKNICAVGYEISSKYTFPAYAVASVHYFSSYGFHVEELLICALITSRIIKAGILLRFAQGCFNQAVGYKIKPWVVSCVIAAAGIAIAIMGISSNSGVQRWLGLSLWPIGILCGVIPTALAAAVRMKEKMKAARG